MLHAQRRLILARAETGRALEYSLQVERAEPHSSAELRKRDNSFGVVQQAPRPEHMLRLVGNLSRLATQTCAVTGTLGFAWVGEEFHRIATRAAARTRRPAKDSRGTHGEDEAPVLPGVPRQHLLPFVLKFGLHVYSVAQAG